MPDVDRRARRKLIIASVLSLSFMIAEVFGRHCKMKVLTRVRTFHLSYSPSKWVLMRAENLNSVL